MMFPRLAHANTVLLMTLGCLLAYGCTTRTQLPDRRDGEVMTLDGSPGVDAAGTDAGVDAGPRPDAGPNLDDVLIYAHSDNTLYTFSPFTNMVTEIGPFLLPSGDPAPDMLDLAVDSVEFIFTSGEDGRLYSVNKETAVATEVGSFGLGDSVKLFALSFLATDESPDGSEMLIGATNEGEYFEIDRATGRTNRLGQYPSGWSSSGDIVSVAGLGTFATLRRDGDTSDTLATIHFAADGRSTIDIRGPIVSAEEVDFRQLFGLGYWGQRLYGFTGTGQLLEIDRGNGRAVEVSSDTGASKFWGAGVTTAVPFIF